MPTYTYHCDACDSPFEKVLPMSRYDELQECPECGEKPARKTYSAGNGFILKGDGWAGKNMRINNQMKKNRARAGARQNTMVRDAPSVTLAPNVGGERVGSWSEASKLAKAKGKETSGYDKLARKEKADKK